MVRDDWKQPFETLKQKIEPLVEANLRLFHANVMTPFHDQEQVKNFTSFLEPAQMADDLIGVFESPTSGSRHHAHYFYGDGKALSHMENVLSDLHTWLADVPSGLLPEFALPAFKSQTQKNLVLWSNLVYVLAWKFERWYLSADIECQRKLDVVDFHLWEELVQPPGIEPRPVLTHQKHGGKEFDSWPSSFHESSCTIPEYIGAYLRDTGSDLCGEYLRASLAAIDLLFAMSNEGLVPDESTVRQRVGSNLNTQAPRTKRSRRPTQGALSTDEEILHSYLIALHGCESGTRNFKPYENQTDVARVLSENGSYWDQVRVSRTLKKLLSRATTRYDHLSPHMKYESLCREKMICKILIDIRVRSIGRGMAREYGFENMDLFATDDSENEE